MDWTKVVDLEHNTLFKITKEDPYDRRLFAKLSEVIKFRAFPRFHTDYTESTLFRTWEDEGASADVLLVSVWLRDRVLEQIRVQRKKLREVSTSASTSRWPCV